MWRPRQTGTEQEGTYSASSTHTLLWIHFYVEHSVRTHSSRAVFGVPVEIDAHGGLVHASKSRCVCFCMAELGRIRRSKERKYYSDTSVVHNARHRQSKVSSLSVRIHARELYCIRAVCHAEIMGLRVTVRSLK